MIKVVLRHDSAINRGQDGLDLGACPSPTIMTSGVSAFGGCWIERSDGQAVPPPPAWLLEREPADSPIFGRGTKKPRG